MTQVTQLFPAYKDTARLTEFAGYSMPLFFTGIIEEVLAVRNSVGMFDVSHMGRFRVSGFDAASVLNYILTVDVEKAEPGRALYGFICNESGGVVDDLITYKVAENSFYMVVNCANRAKDLAWIKRFSGGKNIKIEDITDSSILVAVQGPKSATVMQEFGAPQVKRFRFATHSYAGHNSLIARTGYTGEDGFEILVEDITQERQADGIRLWNELKGKIRREGGLEAGLGARDTLRLEAGLPLHGNDISEEINPFEAGLGRFVDLTKPSYVGKQAHEVQSKSTDRTLIGLVCQERLVPRAHNPVFSGGRQVGIVTSGTYSPILKKGICMALVERDSVEGDSLEIEIRGVRCRAELSQMPFYNQELYGFRRKKNET